MAVCYSMPPMVDNPQFLVPSITKHVSSEISGKASQLDAIYVPFKDRIECVKGLLNELNWFEGPIYLLPTDAFGLQPIDRPLTRNIKVLAVDDAYRHFYAHLLTSRHKHTNRHKDAWDLPLKRNFAIQHAIKMGHERILLVDDDIRSISKQCLRIGADCLGEFVLAGCFVDDFPDTSVLGHLEMAAGEHIDPFLSGSFLFIRPQEVLGFFPCLYNEDWLFMIPQIMNGSICSFGTIRQLEFDPFSNMERPLFQEFGDVIIEGLFALLASKQYEYRHETKVWSDFIFQRREILHTLYRRLSAAKHRKIITAMLKANDNITPEDCRTFIYDWEADLKLWKTYIGGFK
jgi:hypothetical protein